MSGKPVGTRIAVVVCLYSLASISLAGITWFDEVGGGRGYDSFGELAKAYTDFMPDTEQLLTFDGLGEGTILGQQYLDLGVSFENTIGHNHSSWSGIQEEGGSVTEDLTGYDGTYMPNGDSVYLKFDNNDADSPFTMSFDKPISAVGAFLGMGTQGKTHSVQITLYDADDSILGTRVYESWLWESKTNKQNYETFFGVQLDEARISSVSILNLATASYADGLAIDNLEWSHKGGDSGAVPEPASSLLLAVGIVVVACGRRTLRG
ncbi:MAG: PEP-CTERM sorting domain-containing protein [Phycisphaerae bacterium]|nr:PEP-CTERM sorting domain-containing protein [Phycisphaerae bacterium]